MGRVTGSWERPIQGVSQQADKDRIDGQCTLQENMTPSPLDGLITRTGTRHVNKLLDSTSPNSLWYSYSRGDEESYIILIEPFSAPRVFNISGVERSVSIAGGDDSYYKVPNPKKTLRLHTISDYTFILNTERPVEALTSLTPENPKIAIVYCQFATYARDYIIKIDGAIMAKYTTPDGEVSSDAYDVRTNYVAEQLYDQLRNNQQAIETRAVEYNEIGDLYYITVSSTVTVVSGLRNLTRDENIPLQEASGSGTAISISGDFVDEGDSILATYTTPTGTVQLDVQLNENTLYISKLNNTSFTIETSDSSSGNDLIAIQDTVKSLTNLPPYAPEGYVVKVQNQEGYDANSYWLKAEAASDGDDQTGSTIRWVETLAQNEKYLLDLDTMPHTLVSESNGTFTLDKGEWESKRVGNELTNPFPSFVGNVVNSVGTFQNRLIFTSGESAVFSRTNKFFDFFRESTQVVSESDPVDIFADSDEINILYNNKVLDGDLVFFSSNGQFIVDGSKPITSSNVILKKVTSFPVNITAEPAITGESIIFAYNAGKNTGLREMFTDSFTDTKKARPLTEHVAEYITGKAVDLISSPNINTLLIRTEDSKEVLYVYDWLWSGDQKVQSAFHKWIIGDTVLFAKFIKDEVYLVVQREIGIHLERLPLQNDVDDSGVDFSLRLDRRALTTATFDGTKWSMSLPYKSEIDNLVMVRGEGCWDADRGTSIIFEKVGDNQFISYDDLSESNSCTLTAGTCFESRYIPTKPFLKDINGRAMGLDRFTLGKVSINYESIGDTSIIVKDIRARREWRYEYNGRLMGGWNNRVGFAPLDAGVFEFPVRLQSSYSQIEVITKDYRPLIIRDMEWEGMFKQRGRRL